MNRLLIFFQFSSVWIFSDDENLGLAEFSTGEYWSGGGTHLFVNGVDSAPFLSSTMVAVNASVVPIPPSPHPPSPLALRLWPAGAYRNGETQEKGVNK
jgi:hypothetical protein